MRPSTIVFLIALILAFAWFGLKGVSIALGVIIGFFVLFLAAIATGLWFLKRNMQRRLAELKAAVDKAHTEFAANRGMEPKEAIDVELERVREGDSATWTRGEAARPGPHDPETGR